jgi:hypothetical protein
VSFGAPFCAYCRGPLTWGAIPLLGRGDLVMHCDATQVGVLPKRGPVQANETKAPNGVLVTVPGMRAVTGELGARRRHGCIVIRVTALDPWSSVGVAARRHAAPGSCGYSLQVIPFYRVVNLSRFASTSKSAYIDPMHEYEFHPATMGLGAPNEIELRCADSILQIFVNGQQVGACLDATFGFGGFGWRVESTSTTPGRAVVHAVSLYGVA